MMDRRLIFVTHPDVVVDPACRVTEWRLSETGRQRAHRFALSDVVADVTRIWCSAERKALETAEILAAGRGVVIEVDPRLGENDRSATGFLAPPDFELAANAFFAEPDQSFRGWERAVDAQDRILRAVHGIAAAHRDGDVVIVSHGGVGTLLHCALSGLPIDRRYDQPHQGHWWSAELPDLIPQTGWTPVG